MHKDTIKLLAVKKMKVLEAVSKVNKAAAACTTIDDYKKIDPWITLVYNQAYRFRLHKHVVRSMDILIRINNEQYVAKLAKR